MLWRFFGLVTEHSVLVECQFLTVTAERSRLLTSIHNIYRLNSKHKPHI
ncbi:hypothetical protein VCR4J5_1510211 [Vibrio crassostreae]|uniref:Uncharacterized protein n=1 Tax=Vibrio crassostreae TaxID=246167 RepID=A0A822MPJ9_9VIBR|nr:hypothetical protein VCR19J5_1210550 [Vibrio crassostreae]CDT06423.1 hypothetical protein VCR15J5_30172 [Vibrio crassostreae]CDT06903.1 hypothetical protein VCR5J5_1430051 [Vibrio crassostreae]CDT12807.1 hypothetical protein VCR4J5_1510211 [Vibrio crassostreae]CDT50154.1 hypothetical protein VCR9J2_720165 [Vibrio crassostreae]